MWRKGREEGEVQRTGAMPPSPRGGGDCLVLQILRKWAMKGLDRRGWRGKDVADFCRDLRNQEMA